MPFVLQIFGAVGLVGYLSFQNGQKAVNELGTKLSGKITDNIEQHVQNYIEIPRRWLQLNAATIHSGENLEELSSLERLFWQQLQATDFKAYIYFGSQQGEFIGIEPRQTGETLLKIKDQFTVSDRQIYSLDNQGKRLELINTDSYEPHTRPWYTAAEESGEFIWSIYLDAFQPIFVTTPALPIYDQANTFQGVMAIDLPLTKINDFLKKLQISDSGKAFIIERSGAIVATSTEMPPFVTIDQRQKRLFANEHRDPLIKATAEHLYQNFDNLNQIKVVTQPNFEIEGAGHFLQVTPLHYEGGLDWLIVVVIPESDFMEEINANRNTTIWLCLIALVVATGLGVLTSRWITQPILQLKDAAQALERDLEQGQLEQEDFDEIRVAERFEELGVLARAFNSMKRQLQQSFTTLATTNEQLAEQ
ncbi:MAG: HAMP domain-containing protein, partial [Symploca sp. SIO3E6]|nr:HAMP domain-containing protein [Caldora sp. SIO3E6]